MAYPTVEAPYGLLPINLIGGQVYAGATRQIPVASNYATAIFFGDVVSIDAAGLLVKDTGTITANPIGVFMGCTYTDPVFGKVFRQYYPGNIVANDIAGIVVDDPDALFKVAVVSATTVMAAAGRTMVGNNAALVQNSGSTSTGNSRVAITDFATTATLPVRVIDVVPDTALQPTTSVGSTSGSSTTVTLTAANANIKKFMGVSGTGIAAGTFVSAISGTTLTLSAAADLTAVTLTFTGAPEVIVKWNAPAPALTINFTAETASVASVGGHRYLNPVGV
jgi:hypothetical protein